MYITMKFLVAVMMLTATSTFGQWNLNQAETLDFVTGGVGKNLAVDPAGNVHTIFRSGNQVMYYKRLVETNTWLEGETITDSLSAGQIGEMSIAWNDATEQPIVAFQSNARIWFAERHENGLWTRLMMGNPNEDASSPDVAVNLEGTIYVMYITDDQGDYQIDYGYFDGVTWTFDDIAANLGDFGLGASPRVAVAGDGTGHALFRTVGFSGYRVQHATNHQAGGTDWTLTVLDVPHGESYPGDIAVQEDGTVHCITQGSDGFGSPAPVYYHQRDDQGTWNFGTLASSDLDAGDPVIAFDSEGFAHTFWQELDGNFYTGYLYYSSESGFWQPNEVFDNMSGGTAFEIGGDNYGHLLFEDANGDTRYLKSREPLGGNQWGPEISIDPDTLVFDTVFVGQDSTLEVTLMNPNEAVLRITGFDVVSPAFHLTEEWHTVTLMWGWSTTVDIRFAPQGNQFYSGYAVITSDAITSPDTLYLRGRGLIANDAPDVPLPLEFALKPLYPNPFNGAVNVSFSLPRESDVSLKVYDVLGREVELLVGGMMQAGSHVVQWNCAECAAGVYLFKLEAGAHGASAADAAANFVSVQKAVFAK